MKKFISKFLSMILIAAMIVTTYTGFSGGVGTFAAEEDKPLLIATNPSDAVKVFVSISNKGDLVVRQQTVEVSDTDADGKLTMCDALYCAHEKYYEGGAEAGFSSMDASASGYKGISLSKLWGDDSLAFGYTLNDVFANSLADEVADGDYIMAWIYSDQETWSDAYSFFNVKKLGASKNTARNVYLKASGFDENWNAVMNAVSGATIINGSNVTELKTDKNGKVKIKFDKAGSYFITAKTDDMLIVPPTLLFFVHPEVGETITVKDIKYTVKKNGTIKTGKKGKVTFSKSENAGKTAPATVDFAGVTYKVKVVK